jgi:hypothetical protein
LSADEDTHYGAGHAGRNKTTDHGAQGKPTEIREALRGNAAEVPMVRCMSLPIPSMIGCITLRW